MILTETPMTRTVAETGIATETETVAETETATGIVTEDAAAIPGQCQAHGIMIAVATMITETLQGRISRESEEERPAAAIINRIKYLYA